MKKVLIIDDEKAVCRFLYVMLAQTEKYEVETLSDSRQAFDKLEEENFDILLLDMDMPNVSGLDILKYIANKEIDVEAIVLTGVDDVELAVEAMKSGAYDYLRKPVDNELLLLTMERALERRSMRGEIARLKKSNVWEGVQRPELFSDIITAHPRMIKIFRFIEKVAPTNTSVLIWGESGTGKELIAKAIHRAGDRADKPFVAVNAGAFARELFASEFFGHTRGAFSGAYSDKQGFLEAARGGTLFMDEIGELPIDIQVKLLRVLQSGEFFRVGSTQMQTADVRLVAATNKNLQEEIKKGTFRKDLFYRLNVNSISLPPLRDREGDVTLLSKYFLEQFCEENNRQIKEIDQQVIKYLESYNYPGNVRELQNIINSAAAVESSDKLTTDSLPDDVLKAVEKTGVKKKPSKSDPAIEISDKVLSLEDLEKEHIGRTLQKTEGNRSKAAKILGISRVTLISKIKKYSLE